MTGGLRWLSYAREGKRFITIDSARNGVTVWDAVTLDPIVRVRLEKAPGVLEAGLSGDGRTAVTFTYGKDQGVELWDVASGRSLATLRPPSRAATEIFTDGGTQLNKFKPLASKAEHRGHFWDIVQSLAAPER